MKRSLVHEPKRPYLLSPVPSVGQRVDDVIAAIKRDSPDVKADLIRNNSPCNDSSWSGERLAGDKRCYCGTLQASGAWLP